MTTRATEVVLLTPAGRAAVASLLVAGPLADEVVGTLFHPAGARPFIEQPHGRILLGRWQSAVTGEEVVVCRRVPEQVEVHCHGGQAAAVAIMASLVACGCRENAWQSWSERSADDPIRAAARTALASAPTTRTAAILCDQYHGVLRRAFDEITGHVQRGDPSAARQQIDQLLAWSTLGAHLATPWRVVLAGRPNVGKSSLINALVGYERAIVHSTPGTTRDIVTATTALDGWPIELADTAGLHASTDPIEAAGMMLANQRLATADLVVLVFDASNASHPTERTLLEAWPQALAVANKCDLAEDRTAHGRVALYVSAKTGENMETLARNIVTRLVPASPPNRQPIPFTAEQVAWLQAMRNGLNAGVTT